jgi:hypothetical protein
MPHLEELHLYNINSPTGLDRVQHIISRLWGSLAQSDSLRTLSFVSADYLGSCEQHLFPEQAAISIPNLDIIRFEAELPLDRIANILSSKLATTLRKIVYTPTHHYLSESRKARAVVAMLQGTGIELYMASLEGR